MSSTSSIVILSLAALAQAIPYPVYRDQWSYNDVCVAKHPETDATTFTRKQAESAITQWCKQSAKDKSDVTVDKLIFHITYTKDDTRCKDVSAEEGTLNDEGDCYGDLVNMLANCDEPKNSLKGDNFQTQLKYDTQDSDNAPTIAYTCWQSKIWAESSN